jgi:outer membrane protein OmpA-like peptidoglycan-associated protein
MGDAVKNFQIKVFVLGFASVFLCANSVLAQEQADAPRSEESRTDAIICDFIGTCETDIRGVDGKLQKPETRKFILTKQGSSPTGKVQQPIKKPEVTKAKVSQSRTRPRQESREPAQPRVQMMVQFLLGSAELTPQASKELDSFVAALNSPQLSTWKFIVEGHTDSSGARTRNIELSQERAQSVIDYLTSSGISKDRLTAQGYGPDRPMAGVSSRSQVNRRVEMIPAK